MATLRMSEAEAIRRGILPPQPPKPGPPTPPVPPRNRGHSRHTESGGSAIYVILAVIFAWYIGFVMGLAAQ